MASNTSDSNSGSSNGSDVFRSVVEQAVRSTRGTGTGLATTSFYGSPSKNLRERKQEKVPAPPQSSSGESVIDDTDDDKTYHPSVEADRDSDTPRIGRRRGSLRGHRGAPRTLFNRAIRRAAASPDIFATSSTDSDAGTVQPDVRPGGSRGAGRACGPRGGRGSRRGRGAGRPRGSRGGRGGARPHILSPETSPDDPAPLQHAASQTDAISVPLTATSRPQPPTKINKGRGRKHLSDPTGWRKTLAKKGRAEGRRYTSATSGREYDAAKIGRPCRCPKKCMEAVVPQAVINNVFKTFWNIGDNYSAKSGYLMSAIRARPVKRVRTKVPGKAPKPQYRYIITDEQIEYDVCRPAFASIHGLGLGKIEKIIKDKKKSTTGTPVEDRRGRAPSVNQISGDRLDHVHEHIQMLQVTASHYSRAHSPHRRYLSSEMITRNLFDEYVHWLENKYPGEPAVLQSFYDKIFTTHYNIVKRKPKTDTCDVCTSLNVK
ncbi:unnamed protein product [Meganyctiphanes norvegica]|uniref:Uncharacterized protein n=1 Tax=Meganyctiphanes norvegica TaxID=48144 RepID=A0AAV2RF50_MEGNR